MNILIPWIAIFCFSLGLSVVGMYFQRKEKERREAQRAAAETQQMATATVYYRSSAAQATDPPGQTTQLGSLQKQEKQGRLDRIN
jgi:hypothetical protein